MTFEQQSYEIAHETAVSSAQAQNKPVTYGFRAKRNGEYVGTVTAQPDGKVSVERKAEID